MLHLCPLSNLYSKFGVPRSLLWNTLFPFLDSSCEFSLQRSDGCSLILVNSVAFGITTV